MQNSTSMSISEQSSRIITAAAGSRWRRRSSTLTRAGRRAARIALPTPEAARHNCSAALELASGDCRMRRSVARAGAGGAARAGAADVT